MLRACRGTINLARRGTAEPAFRSISKFTTKINIPLVSGYSVFVETFQDRTIPPLNIITALLNYIKLTNASLPLLEATPSCFTLRTPSASFVPVATPANGVKTTRRRTLEPRQGKWVITLKRFHLAALKRHADVLTDWPSLPRCFRLFFSCNRVIGSR